MQHDLLVGLASIVVLGVSAHWLSWRLRLPAILTLLVVGFIAGPLSGWLSPDAIFGKTLFPFVSLCVAVILFEGGLSLRFKELRRIGATVRNLSSIGVLITLLGTAALANLILGFSLTLSLLIGSLLVVTGPTVVGPLLRHVRPSGPVGSILRWEGIVTDPIGAILAILVFQAMASGAAEHLPAIALVGAVKSVAIGALIGFSVAWFLVVLNKRFLIPDYLEGAVTLMLVVFAYTLSNVLQHESGLLTVTVMGMVLANQNQIPIKRIVEFKENLQVLIIASLFIALSARLRLSELEHLDLSSIYFVLGLIFIVRPLSVFVSTLGSSLTPRERVFIACVAPRGIVAAAVASLLGLELLALGVADAERLAPTVFLVIIVTVSLYGLLARPIATFLGISKANAQGVLFVGAHWWACKLAEALRNQKIQVLLIDTNYYNVEHAWSKGLPAVYGNVLDEEFLETLDSGGLSKVLALTSNDEVNTLAGFSLVDTFGRSELFKIHSPSGKSAPLSKHLRIRLLHGEGLTFQSFQKAFDQGATIETIEGVSGKTGSEVATSSAGKIVPLFVITAEGVLHIVTETIERSFEKSDRVLAVVTPG